MIIKYIYVYKYIYIYIYIYFVKSFDVSTKIKNNIKEIMQSKSEITCNVFLAED